MTLSLLLSFISCYIFQHVAFQVANRNVFVTGVLIILGDLLQDPVKESPRDDQEDNNVVTLDVIQHTRNAHEEGPTRGEDWEEVSSIHRNLHAEKSVLLGKTSSPVSQVSSQASSGSSCDDYIILPDCFDTSRPLGESMHVAPPATVTSADNPREEEEEEEEMEEDDSTLTAQRGREEQREAAVEEEEEESENTWPPAGPPGGGSVNQLLCTSQTLDTVTLTPEVAPAPAPPPDPLLSPPALYSPR